ncbi:LAETG motif-containing sortase-dependent surface protein [Streptomyces wuyuanensis]|uniref:LAETG motif-containing sortase-dependent surface protein n=1 Tax=Streptomyces wuyuanensis TaxID=1196353 RepID=UPI003825CA1A
MTTPAVLFGASPAFADSAPTASVTAPAGAEDAATHAGVLRNGALAGKLRAGEANASERAAKPSIEDLEKAAAEAQKAYDDAVAAEKAALAAMEATLADDFPLAVAARAAREKAADAATAKTNADQALADAEAALAALPETATPEEKAAAEKAVADAATAAGTAAAAKTAADEAAKKAGTDLDDARVASGRALGKAREAAKKALETKKAADKALEDALEEQEPVPCEPESELTAKLSGLPAEITAGSTVEMKLRITNGTGRTLDEVWPFVYFHAIEKGGYAPVDDHMHLQWSTPIQTWTDADDYTAGSVSALKAGAHADIKLRLTVDADTPDAVGAAFLAADYVNEDGSCGGSPELTTSDFAIAAKPAPSASPSPSTSTGTGTQTQTTTTQPLTTTSGSLASTGSSSALPQLAAAAGAALVLGAGAVFAARRRKADSAS